MKRKFHDENDDDNHDDDDVRRSKENSEPRTPHETCREETDSTGNMLLECGASFNTRDVGERPCMWHVRRVMSR
jgi:hypothetical protein